MAPKCSKIRHIVWLRHKLCRWRRRASMAAAPSDVPAGHVAICVGRNFRRFIVRTSHLNHPIFRQLLQKAEDDDHGGSSPRTAGPLSLPSCDEELFEDILRHISSSSSSSKRLSSAKLHEFHASFFLCCCQQWHGAAGDSLPLLRGLTEKSVW